MFIKIFMHKIKFIQRMIAVLLLIILTAATLKAQGFKTLTPLTPITATAGTLDKPQSKLWFYQGYWFTVIPITVGTYVYRLDGTTWTQLIKISAQTLVRADVKLYGNNTYIILKDYRQESSPPPPQFQSVELITIEFQAGSPPTYIISSPSTNISLDNFAETATIDIDGNGRMWLASDGGQPTILTNPKNITVKWSDPPYTIWSTSIILASGVNYDDISDITSFGGNKIGVLWSDQNLKKFGFAYHIDGDAPTNWTYETAASDASNGGIADDHINLAVASDGTIYAAVKTSYTNNLLPTIGLLVRRPSGTWDPIYRVTKYGDTGFQGTRPIVLLNENANILSVFFTQSPGSNNVGNDLLYKETSLPTISFPDRVQYLRNGTPNFNDISSTKQNYTDSVVIVFANYASTTAPVWEGVIAKRIGAATTNGAGYSLAFDGSNDQLRVETNPSLNFSGSFSIEAWIKPGISKNQSILNKYNTTPTPHLGYDLSLTSGGKVIFTIDDVALTSNQSYSTNVWTHIAVTYSSVTSTAKIYVNGLLDPLSANTPLTDMTGNSTRLYIGSLISNNRFNGSLDEIRLWNSERSIDDIRADMCKKLTGSESNLVGYWNFDTREGLNVPDKTSNNNYATMYDMENYTYGWSGAAIGDESAYDYTLSGGFIQTLSHTDGDMITAEATSGFVSGLQLYRVDSPPLRPGAVNVSPDFTITDPLRYWGVKIIGTSTPTYTITYNYNGHPGITDENTLNLISRTDLSDNTWDDLLASLNTGANTLIKTGLTGTEFALASTNAPLPVELSTFSASIVGSSIKLNWKTESEVNNYGFDVERTTSPKSPPSQGGEDEVRGGWEKIGFVNGNGNSNSPKNYSFEDKNVLSGKYSYRLKQIDNDGKFEYSKEIQVDLGAPKKFELSQNYPNPFNPSTKISYTLPVDSRVSLKVYDILGNLVETLVDEQKQAGYYEVNFSALGGSASGGNATNLSSGIYFYSISADNFNQTKKMILLK